MMFTKGEIAVLVHRSGARLFEVSRVEAIPGGDISNPDDCRVYEPAWEEGQPEHDVHSSSLVQVADRDAAVALVALINYVHGSAQEQVNFIEHQRDEQVRRLTGRYRKEED